VALAQTQPAPPPAPPGPPAGPIGWPPKLEVNQTWVITIDGIGTWELRLSGRDADGDPVGTARAQTKDAKDLQAFFYFKRADDQAYLALTDGSITTLCTFDSRSVKGETMFGATFTRAKTDTGFKPIDNVCAATLDPLAKFGLNPSQPSTPPSTAPSSTTPSNAAPWLRLQPGQVWRVTIPDLGAWNVTLNGTDADGDPLGFATGAAGSSSLDAFFYYAPQEQNAVLQLSDGTRVIGCVFPKGSLSGSTLNGSSVLKSGRDTPFENTGKACTASLSSGPSVAPTPASTTPSSTSPSSATNPPPSSPPAAPSSAAVWPPRIALGQVWTVDLGSTRYDLALTRLVNNQATGPATTPKIRAEAVFSYDPKTNRATLEITGAATIQVCTFDAKSPKGAGYVGTVAYRTGKNGPLKPVNGSCVATLLRPGTSVIVNPLGVLENTVWNANSHAVLLGQHDLEDLDRPRNTETQMRLTDAIQLRA
jgi:hypothetical protein